MAPLPKNFSSKALPIEAALSEGRTNDARTLIVDSLLTGEADGVVQRLAAEMLKPPKRKRGRQKALTQYWLEIGEQFHRLRREGTKYEDALCKVADKFGYSETHVRKAIAEYEDAKEAHDEASRE
ncbi:hypothetical protein G6N74_25045 [Mesorhizobium sp. CGMCC 1.15528]|uniref:Uncharacterized protein n=1 Tax=Mesorhizobium zhangyense TaxID=1776730 RepID=A0A7C9VB16_9HYPH|nr:hypothetical protein [Mesorhizobium zhangyense]NGN44343.1 hypothetical protein [Mesorhizobium zhangyense]